ncbi:hypothetical protein [Haloechinothrix sp. LS1_15]|uniref:hypothetical protein n=1 Tax=Haloechinothrix sp. LS1_15 TaxID=2652248 RepID=UPI0029451A25|nr:hypothetical protein [Haloechinothrix sp. LS1_15]MDV6013300.1 hypothetical protein [Haloechinothrix sp. LS1_15]
MRRLFWFGVGFAAGFAVCRKANEAAREATPAGLASNVGEAVRELAGAVGAFGADVRAGMSEREVELSEFIEHTSGQVPRSAVEPGRGGRHVPRDDAGARPSQYRRARPARD